MRGTKSVPKRRTKSAPEHGTKVCKNLCTKVYKNLCTNHVNNVVQIMLLSVVQKRTKSNFANRENDLKKTTARHYQKQEFAKNTWPLQNHRPKSNT